jgi:hypothetical protein
MDAIIAFGAGSQIGELSIGAVAGRDIVTNNTIISPAAVPSIERAPLRPPPRPLRGFRNREAERAQLLAECQPRGGAWLTGVGGIGASALLRQLAGTGYAQLPDGVTLLHHTDLLAPTSAADTRAALLLDDVAQLLFDSFYRSSDPTRRIRIDLARSGAYLGPLQALVVLDRLPLTRAQLERLADTLAGSALFIAAPGPASELLLDLPIRGLPRTDALALLAGASGITADDGAEPHLAALCTVLDDHPLALLLAGALIQAGVVSLPTLAEGTAGLHDAPNVLNRACRLSLDALAPSERRLLTTLVVGEPDLATADLAAISELAPAELIPALERLSVLRLVSIGADRAAISFPSLRQELTRLLQPAAERKRAAAFFAAAAATKTFTPDWITREAQNLLAAAELADSAALPGLVGPLAQAVHPYTVLSGQWSTWQTVADLAFAAADREDDPALRAWALHEQGTCALFSGAPQAGIAQLQTALALRKAAGDPAAALTEQNIAFSSNPVGAAARMHRLWITLGGLALLLFVGLGLFVTSQAAQSPPATATALPSALAPTPIPPPPTIALTPTNTPAPLTGTVPLAPPAPTTPPDPTPAATVTLTPTSTLAGLCRIIVPALNLRQGPGPIYPVIRVLPNGTIVQPIAQAFNGAWLEVRVDVQQGWIAQIGPQPLIECFGDLSDLPPGIIPAPPLPTSTPSTTRTATATTTPAPQPAPTFVPTSELPAPTATPTVTRTPTRVPTRAPIQPPPELPPPTSTPSPTMSPTTTSSPAPTATPSPSPAPTITPSPIIPG